MKRILFALLLSVGICNAQQIGLSPGIIGAAAEVKAAAAPFSDWLFFQDFESGTQPSGMPASGTVIWNATGIEGTYSVQFDLSDGTDYVYTNFASVNEVWAKMKLRLSALPTAQAYIFDLDALDASARLCSVSLDTGGHIIVNHGTVFSSASTGAMSGGTSYYIWLHYNNSAGTASAAFSSSNTEPTSGDNFVSVTGGNAGQNARSVALIGYAGWGTYVYTADHLGVATSDPGSN